MVGTTGSRRRIIREWHRCHTEEGRANRTVYGGEWLSLGNGGATYTAGKAHSQSDLATRSHILPDCAICPDPAVWPNPHQPMGGLASKTDSTDSAVRDERDSV